VPESGQFRSSRPSAYGWRRRSGSLAKFKAIRRASSRPSGLARSGPRACLDFRLIAAGDNVSSVTQHHHAVRMVHDRGPIKRARHVEPIVAIDNGDYAVAGYFDPITPRKAHKTGFCADSFQNEKGGAGWKRTGVISSGIPRLQAPVQGEATR
jgi:hypothetical protein